ncbi:hypothetical protein [Clostridium sp.]|uniref:hypothetical protein n=1 Tax=Clostridium sp. TaxID=1506 RepID=UPI002FC706BC
MSINSSRVEGLSRLIADRFLNDPRLDYTLDGIEDRFGFLVKYGKSEINGFMKHGDVRILGENEGIIIGYNKKEMGWFKYLKSILSAQNSLFKSITKEEKKKILENSKVVKKVSDISWHKRAVNTNGYYHVLTLAVRGDLKGTGAFRRLITPLIEECNEKNICIVLETNNKDNIPIYDHFDFKIFETLESDDIDLVQYSMIRYPGKLTES